MSSIEGNGLRNTEIRNWYKSKNNEIKSKVVQFSLYFHY